MRQSKLPDINLSLPIPEPEAMFHSQKLSKYIKKVIDEKGGSIGFDEYMNLALYHCNLGYYNSSTKKFGAEGDFVTAPQISTIFSKLLVLVYWNISHGGAPIDGAGPHSSPAI